MFWRWWIRYGNRGREEVEVVCWYSRELCINILSPGTTHTGLLHVLLSVKERVHLMTLSQDVVPSFPAQCQLVCVSAYTQYMCVYVFPETVVRQYVCFPLDE